MVHVTEYAECGELMWATRLTDSDGEYECWELLSPKAVYRVSGFDPIGPDTFSRLGL